MGQVFTFARVEQRNIVENQNVTSVRIQFFLIDFKIRGTWHNLSGDNFKTEETFVV